MNVIMAIVVTLLLGVLLATGVIDGRSEVTQGIFMVIQLNWVLCFFNLIPVYPLDGGHFTVALYERIRGREADVAKLAPIAAEPAAPEPTATEPATPITSFTRTVTARIPGAMTAARVASRAGRRGF